MWPIFTDSIEARSGSSEEAADELVSATPELEELYKRADSLEKEQALNELLEEAVDQRWSLIRDSLDECRTLVGFPTEKEATRLASKYLETQWAHAPRLTNYLAANLIASVIGEARHHMGWGKRYLKILPGPITRSAFSVLLFLFLLGLAVFFFREVHSLVLGCLTIAFMLWNYGRNLLLDLKMRSFCGTLHFIAVEIDSGRYDREETIRRLQRIDDDRLIRFAVPSLVYPLLRLPAVQ